jgi:hypothetical protein
MTENLAVEPRGCTQIESCFEKCVASSPRALFTLRIRVPAERLRAGPPRRLAPRATLKGATDTPNPICNTTLVSCRREAPSDRRHLGDDAEAGRRDTRPSAASD